jgi:hypothetical protein
LDDELCPSNLTSTKEFIVVNGMANSDLFQVNPIPNQYVVYLDLVYCNFPERPFSRLDRHHPAFILTCKTSYLKYISLGRRVKRFDFGGISAQLVALDGCALFLDLGIDNCIEKFYIIIREYFDRFLPFYYSVDSENRQPWFDKELCNLDNIRTKSHKYMKEL